MNQLRARGLRLSTQELSFALAALLLISQACSQQKKAEDISEMKSLGSIIYDTSVLNNNAEDTWTDECLANFQHQVFIDQCFDAVYQNNLVATDYFSGEEISAKRLREMEAKGEIDRKKIVKVRFEEDWKWNKQELRIEKIIRSVTLAYEVFNPAGESRGYKPIFTIHFK